LPHGGVIAWQKQANQWQLPAQAVWVLSGVNPPALEQLKDWLLQRGDTVLLLDKARHLPLQTRLEHPDKAGIDRLLNAVAANARRPEGVPAVIVDAGSAVTVDYVDETGAFCGGAIFPGVRLMMHALNDYTALLPLVEVAQPVPSVPCGITTEAMQAGVFWAVAGGVQAVVDHLGKRGTNAAAVFLTGGDAALLRPGLQERIFPWPTMTLEGARLAAEHLP
jgi:type III pantothenate kinase